MINDNQLINIFVNLNTIFTNLYELKFSGRKILEELINTSFQLSLMKKHGKKDKDHYIIYQEAVRNCQLRVGEIMATFEEEVLQPYNHNTVKMKLNTDHLEGYIEKGTFEKGQLSPYEFLLLQLINLGLDLGRAYFRQNQLIRDHWHHCGSELILSEGKYQQERMKELMLHVAFESSVKDGLIESWKQKMAAASNQRYNPKKM